MLHKETSISTSVAELCNTITINDMKVVMIAQLSTAFKLLQILNHWIDNLIQHHHDNNKVNNTQACYIKWRAKYPFIQSLKRKFIDVYCMITEDYTATTETANLYALVLYFQNQYPEFTNCYNIKPIESKEDDQNYFEFMLTLYFASYSDNNNNFNDICSSHSFFVPPFSCNNSVTTWKQLIQMLLQI
jgi:hypothetical protein